MKIFYVAALWLIAAEASSDPAGENRQFETQQQAPQNQLLVARPGAAIKLKNKPAAGQFTEHKLMVITGARFVPLDQFLGLPNLNDLPPASAGIPANPASEHPNNLTPAHVYKTCLREQNLP